MDSSRSSSNGGKQTYVDIMSRPVAGVTSVWVGTRPPAKTIHCVSSTAPSPPHSLCKETAQNETKQPGFIHRPSPCTESDRGQYVVVSVRDSSHAGVTADCKSSSTLIHPTNKVICPSGNQSPSSNSEAVRSCTEKVTSDVSPVTTLKFSSDTVSGDNSQSSVISPSTLPLSHGMSNAIFPWHSYNHSLGNNVLAGSAGNLVNNINELDKHNNVFGGSYNGLGMTGNALFNSGNALFNSGNALFNSGNVYGHTNPLNTFTPALFSSLTSLPLTGWSDNNLLFQQPYGLSSDLLSASLGLSQSSSLLQNLLQPNALPQSLWNVSQPQVPVLPSIPYLGQSLDTLSTWLAAGQTFSSPSSTSSCLLSQQLLPTSCATPSCLNTIASGSGFSAGGGKEHLPPLLNQNPSKAFLSKRRSAKMAESKRSSAPADSSSSSHQVHGYGNHKHTQPLDKSMSAGHLTWPEMTFSVNANNLASPSQSAPSQVSVTSAEDEEQTTDAIVTPCYEPPDDMQACMRCRKKVYAMERLGPVKHVLYHKTCFTCRVCNTALSLKNYFHNDADIYDLSVYCTSHRPAAKSLPLEPQSQSLVTLQRPFSVPC